MAHTIYKNSEGTRLPSVTTALSILDKGAGLLHWAWKKGMAGEDYRQERDESALAGTIAHEMIQCDIQNKPFFDHGIDHDIKERALNAFAKYIDWRDLHPFSSIVCEGELVSEQFQYGGTIDLYCEFNNGSKWLVDHKTSKGIYDSHLYQLAAYKHLLQEHGHQVDGCMILRIGRDEGDAFEVHQYENLDAHFAIFQHALEIYNLQKQINQKNKKPRKKTKKGKKK